jgi:hypothetical protein
MALRIRDWNEHFETHKTRILKRLDWVPIPNRMDGLGYIRLLDHPEGAAHFGAWIALVELASKGATKEERGTLTRNGKALSVEALSILSRIPERIIADAIPRLLKIGWLEGEIDENPARPGVLAPDNAGSSPDLDKPNGINETALSGATPPESGALAPGDGRRREGKEGNGTEGKEGKEPAAAPPEPPALKVEFPDFKSEPTFVQFKAVAIQYGIKVSEAEWREFEQYTWPKQDWTQKLKCIRGLEDRIKAGDDSLVGTTPKNYAERAYYERHIREPGKAERNGHGGHSLEDKARQHRENKQKILEGKS